MAGTTTYFGISYPQSTDLVKDGAANMQTIATGFDSAVAIPTYNAQTGTTYTFALSDIGKTVTASNAGASTYTIPPQASVVWPTGTTINITNLGAGVVTFAAGAGVTVTNTAVTLAQYASAALVRTGLNAWTVTSRSGGGASGLTLLNATNVTAQSTASISNVFNSSYSRYRILVSLIASSGNQTLLFRCRENTTDKATDYIAGQFEANYLGATNANVNNSGTSFQIATNVNTSDPAIASWDIYRTATRCSMLGQGWNYQGAKAYFTAGQNANMTNFTGFSIFVGNTGTMTGSIAVYGYQES